MICPSPSIEMLCRSFNFAKTVLEALLLSVGVPRCVAPGGRFRMPHYSANGNQAVTPISLLLIPDDLYNSLATSWADIWEQLLKRVDVGATLVIDHASSENDKSTLQPFCREEVIVRFAPINSARSRMPDNPMPGCSSVTNPLPSSRMLTLMSLGK